jgi:hypothetical protein
MRLLEGRFYNGDTSPIVRSTIDATFYTTGAPVWHQRAMDDGTCSLWTFAPQQCDMFCSNGVCTGRNQCTPFPMAATAGTLNVTGLNLAVSMTPDPTLGRYYYQATPPADLFAPGAAITLNATGGFVPAFTARATGVPPLQAQIQGGHIDLLAGQDYTLRWTPATGAGAAETRVRLTVNSPNGGHGQPYKAIIECDAPDAAGELTVPRAMVDALPRLLAFAVCAGVDCPPSYVMRYSRGTAAVTGGYVELLVGDQLAIGVNHSP